MELTQLESLVSSYQQGSPDAMRKIEPQLSGQRIRLAEMFLNASDTEAQQMYHSEPGKAYAVLRRAGLHNLLRSPEEQRTADKLLHKWQELKVPSAGVLLGSMLMFQAYELPIPTHFSHLLPWMRTAYAQYLMNAPALFHQIGEAERFADFWMNAMNLFHQSLLSEESFPEASEIADIFMQQSDFTQFYFNEKVLSRAYRQRAEIMEFLALKQKMPLANLSPLRGSSEKIRVGILAASLTPNPETFLLISYIDKLPKEYCDITLYCLRQNGNILEDYCRSRADKFVVLSEGADNSQKAQIIRADDLDVLIIGTNITNRFNSGTKLAMFRMARTHIVVENSPVTTGFTSSDYYLSSWFNDTEFLAQEQYSERLYRVPGMIGYYAYHLDTEPKTTTITRASLKIPQNAVVYFSGAKIFKILPEVSDLWAKILSRVPNSFLILMPFHPDIPASYPIRPFIKRINTQMSGAGVDFNRIRFLKLMPTRADIHGVMENCDAYLDSFPYSGACSLTDPLTAGLPTIVRSGKTLRGNIAAGMLRAIGMEETIAANSEEYVEKAVKLGTDPAWRDSIRHRMKTFMSRHNPFSDTASCGIKLLAAFRDINDVWRKEALHLMSLTIPELKARIQTILTQLFQQKNPYIQNLVGNEIIRLLLIPYFHSSDDQGIRHLIDVGAYHGHSAEPFLNAGWSADLFEPDPACEAKLNPLIERYAGKARLFKQIASHEAENMLIFYQSDPGFSSLEPSPYTKLQQVLFVRSVRLNEVVLPNGRLDLLHIDAQGSDFQALSGYDLKNAPPKCIMLHFDGKFPAQSVEKIEASIADMKRQGYDAIVFEYGDKGGEQRLAGISINGISKQPDTKGAILFYQHEDAVLPATFVRLLESFVPLQARTQAH